MKAEIWERSEWVEETRPDVLMAYYEKRLKDAGFTVRDKLTAFFSPHGFTALFLLSESHLAIHTFPEENRTYVQLSSCIKRFYDRFWEVANASGETSS